MENKKYIRKQIEEHIQFANGIQKANSAFSNQFYHPKTGRRITFNEQIHLINKDLEKRVKRIEKKLSSS